MFSTQFWLIVIGFAQMIGCCWIFNMFQKRAYKREIRSRHSYVLLAKLLAEEERLGRNISKCNEDGTGEVYLGLPEGIVKVFSLGNDRFAISLVGAVIVNDLHADMARELCKDLNTKESRVRYSVGYEPAFTKRAFPLLVTLRMMLTMKLLNITFLLIPKIIWCLSNKNCKRCGNARWKN